MFRLDHSLSSVVLHLILAQSGATYHDIFFVIGDCMNTILYIYTK